MGTQCASEPSTFQHPTSSSNVFTSVGLKVNSNDANLNIDKSSTGNEKVDSDRKFFYFSIFKSIFKTCYFF